MSEISQKTSNGVNEDKHHDHKKPVSPDALKVIILALAGLAAAILIFGAGVKVGGLKARYAYRWADNYHKNFAGPGRGFMMDDWRNFTKEDFMEGHGVFGEIIELNGQNLIIKGAKDTENIIIINQDTVLKKRRDTVAKDALKIGDKVVIIGSPNEQGQIEAKLIRIFNSTDKIPFRRLSPRFF